MKYKILVVDDEDANTRMLERVFRGEFEIVSASSGTEAIELLTVHDVAVIISDQRMPGMSGVELLIRAAEMRPHCVRIILTGYTDANDLVDALNSNVVYKYITKPWINTDLLQTVKRGLSHHETIKAQHRLNLENQRLRDRLSAAENGFVRVFTELLNLKSPGSVEHAARTREAAGEIGRALNLEMSAMKQLSLAAYLHELVNIRISSSHLCSGEATPPEQMSDLADSREAAIKLLAGAPNIEDIDSILRHQTETYDGTGSPDGMDEEKIPLSSRIIAVACAYARMTDPEVPNRMGEQEAMSELRSEAGKRFDPNIVNIFCGLRSLGHLRGSRPEPLECVNG